MQDVDTLAKTPPARAHEGYRLSLESDPRRIRAEFQGETVADSSNVLVMHETRLAPVFYFPREDVRMDLLVKSDRHTHCPFKGNTSYWTIRVGEKSTKDAAWSYETPYDESPIHLQGLHRRMTGAACNPSTKSPRFRAAKVLFDNAIAMYHARSGADSSPSVICAIVAGQKSGHSGNVVFNTGRNICTHDRPVFRIQAWRYAVEVKNCKTLIR